MLRCRSCWTAARLTDVDAVAVARACSGEPPTTMTIGERRAAIAHMRERGVQARTMARRLRVAERTVHRHLAALRATREAA